MATKNNNGWFKMYWSFMEDLTPEAALLLSYLVDIKSIMNNWEGEYFRLSNSFIQERFQTWSDYTIKTKLDELIANGYIDVTQKFKVEHKKGCRTRWIKLNPKSNPEDNPYDNPNNNPNNNPENFGINKINKINKIKQIDYINNAETSSPTDISETTPIESIEEKTPVITAPPPPVEKKKRQSLKDKLTEYVNSLDYQKETKDILFKWIFTVGLPRKVRLEQLQDMLKNIWSQVNDESSVREAINKSYLNNWFGFYPVNKPTTSYKTPATPKNEPCTPPKKEEAYTPTIEEMRATVASLRETDYTRLTY